MRWTRVRGAVVLIAALPLSGCAAMFGGYDVAPDGLPRQEHVLRQELAQRPADAYASQIPRQLEENGYPVTVVSPNACADRTPGHRLARVARSLRISTLRSAGIPVIDWPWADGLDEVVARYHERRHG